MANTYNLLTTAIPGVHTAHIWQCTADSDASGNISLDVSWSDALDAPTVWQAVWCQAIGTSPSSPQSWGGDFTVTIDYDNKRFRIRGKGFPASTTGITFLLIAV